MYFELKKTIKNYLRDKCPYLFDILIKNYNKIFFNKLRKKIRGYGNKLHYENSRLRKVHFDIAGNNNLIYIGNNCLINELQFYIRGDNHQVFIGDNCQFNQGNIWMEDDSCSLNIGNGSTFGDVHLAITEPKSSITIGADCMFAYDIDVRSGDSHSIIDAKTSKRLNFAKNVIIGNHVWVAPHVVILKGVVITDDSIVATGSVVTKSFFENSILIAGNPAKNIKSDVTWLRDRIY
jgi:acetyltransferase-like isoleucine patch superfamily enzyme